MTLLTGWELYAATSFSLPLRGNDDPLLLGEGDENHENVKIRKSLESSLEKQVPWSYNFPSILGFDTIFNFGTKLWFARNIYTVHLTLGPLSFLSGIAANLLLTLSSKSPQLHPQRVMRDDALFLLLRRARRSLHLRRTCVRELESGYFFNDVTEYP